MRRGSFRSSRIWTASARFATKARSPTWSRIFTDRDRRRFSGSAPSQDAKDATQVIGDLDQGGLGLPDRDYYLKTDAKSVDIRKKYVAHVAKMFELAGVAPAEAAQKSRSRDGHRDGAGQRIARRRVAARSEQGVSQADGEGAGFAVARPSTGRKFFEAVGTPPIESLNVDFPPFIRAMEARAGRSPVWMI